MDEQYTESWNWSSITKRYKAVSNFKASAFHGALLSKGCSLLGAWKDLEGIGCERPHLAQTAEASRFQNQNWNTWVVYLLGLLHGLHQWVYVFSFVSNWAKQLRIIQLPLLYSAHHIAMVRHSHELELHQNSRRKTLHFTSSKMIVQGAGSDGKPPISYWTKFRQHHGS